MKKNKYIQENSLTGSPGLPEAGMIGLSHKTASVEVRENFSFDDSRLTDFISKAGSNGVDEIVCLSTCNRTEIYFTSCDMDHSVNAIYSLLEDLSGMPAHELEKILYEKHSADMVLHLLSVASSVDSMVVGENEILGQVKEAYRKSAALKKTGIILNRLFHQAFATAKRVRNETGIGRSPLSIAYIATELAKSIFADISKRRALLIGAGEMGELILKYLAKEQIKEIVIANRSYHNAKKIASEIYAEAHIISMDEINNEAGKADIIITSLGSKDFIITKDNWKDILKSRKKNSLFIIDIGVPRNVDPDIGKINNIFLYNIDDLQVIADDNLKKRLREVETAKILIKEDANKFIEWYEGLSIVPALLKIRNKFDKIRTTELNKYRKRKLKHLSDKDIAIIENLTKQIMTKTLHDPIMYLKNLDSCGGREKENNKHIIRIIEELFGQNK